MFDNRITRHTTENPQDLLANPYNFRVHSQYQQKALAGALEEIGWIQSVIVNETTQHIIDGHARIMIAMREGEEAVPVAWVKLSEDEEKKALAIFDKISSLAGTDDSTLGTLLAEIDEIGIDNQDLDELIKDMEAALERETEDDDGEGEPEPDPPAATDEPVPCLGDVWQIGPHKLIVADSTSDDAPGQAIEENNGKPFDMIFTDPPYAIYGSSTGIAADITDDKMVRPFFLSTLRAIEKTIKTFGHIYVCCDWRSWASWWEVCKKTCLAPKNMIVWNKQGGLGAMYANAHELILFASAQPMQDRMTKKTTGERTVQGANVWTLNRAGNSETGGETREHNAQKPVALMEKAIEQSADKGQTVLDLFGGSGSTLIAADRLGRKCVLFEIDEKFADVILRRAIRDTEHTPKLAYCDDGATIGATYEEVKAERHG